MGDLYPASMSDNPLIGRLKNDKSASVDWVIIQHFRQFNGFVGFDNLRLPPAVIPA
jgi:hypothetical protein